MTCTVYLGECEKITEYRKFVGEASAGQVRLLPEADFTADMKRLGYQTSEARPVTASGVAVLDVWAIEPERECVVSVVVRGGVINFVECLDAIRIIVARG